MFISNTKITEKISDQNSANIYIISMNLFVLFCAHTHTHIYIYIYIYAHINTHRYIYIKGKLNPIFVCNDETLSEAHFKKSMIG